MEYDSEKDTLQHIELVRALLGQVAVEIAKRAEMHDASKLREPEKSMFDEYTPKLRALTYGSDEYKACLTEMGRALQHHYANNRHHPEHYPNVNTPEINRITDFISGLEDDDPVKKWLTSYRNELESRVNEMDLVDIVEMLCDWMAATARHADGNRRESLMINKGRFEISEQLYKVICNTAFRMDWIPSVPADSFLKDS